jgi:hypothetical protein
LISLIVFLVSLPLTIYALAGCLQLIDQRDNRFRALLGLSFRVLLLAALTLATPPEARLWIPIGIVSALLLTGGFQFGIRYAIRSGRWPAGRID